MNWIKYKVTPSLESGKLLQMHRQTFEIEIPSQNVEKSWEYIFQQNYSSFIDINLLIENLSIITKKFHSIPCMDYSKIDRLLKMNIFPKLINILFDNKASSNINFGVFLFSVLKLIGYACSSQNNLFLLGDDFVKALLKVISICSDLQDKQLTHNYNVQNELLKILHLICVGIASDRKILSNLYDPLSDQDWYILFSLLVGYVHCDASLSQRSNKQFTGQVNLTNINDHLKYNVDIGPNSLINEKNLPLKPQMQNNNFQNTWDQDPEKKSCDLGQRSRDDLLLLLSLVSNDDYIAKNIVQKENFCPVLAASLSGLYCSLPRCILYPNDDWYQISDDEIQSSPELSQVIVCLEFCNAFLQVSNPIISSSFLDYIYNGFLLSVIGPALHQISIDEVIAATLYLEMFLKRISETRLLNIFIKFIFEGEVDGTKLINIFINRIGHAHTRMCTAALSLFKTLIDLNSELAMHQLIFRYLLPCNHIMLSQQRSLTESDIYCFNAEAFLKLIPCINGLDKTLFFSFNHPSNYSDAGSNSSADSVVFSSNYELNKSNNKNISQTRTNKSKSISRNTTIDFTIENLHRPSQMISTIESSYFEYLMSAKQIINVCSQACKLWHRKYIISPIIVPQINLTSTPIKKWPEKTLKAKENFYKIEEFITWLDRSFFLDEDGDLVDSNSNCLIDDIDSLYITCCSELQQTFNSDNNLDEESDVQIEFLGGDELHREIENKETNVEAVFEFFRPLPDDNQDDMDGLTLGPFLTSLLTRVELMKSNTLFVNILLTGIVSRLACYPHTLLNSILLSHSLVFQPCVKSLVQVLKTIKQNLEDYFKSISDLHNVIQQAMDYLCFRVHRENFTQSNINNNNNNTSSLNNTFPIVQNQKRTTINVVEFLFGDRLKSNQVQYNTKTLSSTPQKVPIKIENKKLIEKKNAIYALLIFCEFVKELAAISQEQSVALTL